MRLQSEIDVTVWCAKCRKRLTEDLNLTKCEEVGHPTIYVNPCDCQPAPAEVPIRVGQVWESAVAKVRSEVIAIRGERVAMWATPHDSWAPWTTTATELREAEYILVSEPEE